MFIHVFLMRPPPSLSLLLLFTISLIFAKCSVLLRGEHSPNGKRESRATQCERERKQRIKAREPHTYTVYKCVRSGKSARSFFERVHTFSVRVCMYRCLYGSTFFGVCLRDDGSLKCICTVHIERVIGLLCTIWVCAVYFRSRTPSYMRSTILISVFVH